MKNENGFGRKLRYGSTSLGITALVIALVLLVNVAFSAVFSQNHWFTDVTSEEIYTLSDSAKNLLDVTLESVNETRPEEDPVEVDIIFCADPDQLYGSTMMRYVYYTALALEQAADGAIQVSTVDVVDNPSLVDDYRNNSYSAIYPTDVIVSSGTDFRIFPLKSFYTYDNVDATEPWAYSGEKKFLGGIIAVTCAEAPICALTTNHGEPFDPQTGETEYTEFLNLIERAGYDLVFLDLEKDKIPENCRLIITFDPKEDFTTSFQAGAGAVSEISKLDTFLSNAYSYMVFFNADTPRLDVLEEYLEEWGIAVNRYKGEDASGAPVEGTLEVLDPGHSMDTDGSLIIGTYQTGGLGASLTEDMRETGMSPKVLFRNAVSFSYSDSYKIVHRLADEESGTQAYSYGSYYKYEWPRSVYNVFCTGERAFAYAKANGERLTDANGEDLVVDSFDPQNPYRLMTVTTHRRSISEGQGWTNVNDASYVCAVGSTDFVSNDVLSTDSYGNADALVGTLRVIGREVAPVGLKWVTIYQSGMNSKYYAPSDVTVWSAVLIATPAVVMLVAGIWVLAIKRRRY